MRRSLRLIARWDEQRRVLREPRVERGDWRHGVLGEAKVPEAVVARQEEGALRDARQRERQVAAAVRRQHGLARDDARAGGSDAGEGAGADERDRPGYGRDEVRSV